VGVGPTLRLGFFGGAFDPPHIAHAALVQVAIAQLALDEVRIFPTGHAWHKQRQLSAPEHRLAMAQLAFDAPRCVVDPRELLRDGPTYTIDTLRELHADQPRATLFLLLGADQARALPSWHDWAGIAQLASICVAERAGYTPTTSPFDSETMTQAVTQSATRLANSATGPMPGQAFHTLHLPALAVSATDIRNRVATGQSLAGLVAPQVARYIAQHHLYTGT
jgi:nicotinate-nucleotide adenylyltransferase